MSRSESTVRSRGEIPRLTRRVILGCVVAIIIFGVYFVLSQMTKRLTIVNDRSESMTVVFVSVSDFKKSSDAPSGEWADPTVVARNHVIQPHTQLELKFNGLRESKVVVVTQSSSQQNETSTNYWLLSWGSRATISRNAEGNGMGVGRSALRRWFDSIKPWIPLPPSGTSRSPQWPPKGVSFPP
jgi:hypothetical protein